MRLLLDIGNSRLKWALADDALRARGAFAHRGDAGSAFAQLTAQLREPPAAVWMANVAGAAFAESLHAQVRRHWSVAIAEVRVEAERAGLRVAYAQAQRLGVDRWLTMQALWREAHRAFVVVSAGTALTFDAVDAQGQHLGGVIAPGLRAMQAAVLGNTRFAAAGPDDAYAEGLGADTEACVRQGALHAGAGLVERLARRCPEAEARAILSGGDAAILAPHLSGAWSQRPDLVLEGLLALAKESPQSLEER